jgi:iron complex outermembrane recepter protein
MKRILLLGLLIIAQSLSAQTAKNESTKIDSTKTDSLAIYKTAEVIITATRQNEPLYETPMAVSIVDKKTLETKRGYGFDEIMTDVPGVLAQSRTGGLDVRISIRGFGARGAGERSNAGTSRGIRVMQDGFPETEPDGRTAFDLIDLTGAGRVEVVRSNASAVWGNASGGVINVVSNTDFDQSYATLRSAFGSFGFRKESFQAGAILSPESRLFTSINNTTFDGWRDQSRGSNFQFNSGIISQLGAKSKLGVYLLGASNLFYIPGPLTQTQFDVNPQQAQGDTLVFNPTFVRRQERRFNRIGRIGATFEHQFNDANGISTMAYANPKYLQRSERNTFRDFTRYHIGGNFLYRNTLKLSETVKSMFLAGYDQQYQDGAILFYNLVNGQRGNTLSTNKREGANNFGVFFQEELIFSDKFSAMLGGRYDNVNYYNEDFLLPETRLSKRGEKTFSRFTPKAGLTYRFAPTHSVYANLGGGVEVPAGNETDPNGIAIGGARQDTLFALNPLLEPIRSTTLEAGTKHLRALPSNKILDFISYDAAAYWISVTNDIVPYRSGRFYLTAAETERLGMELAATIGFKGGFSLGTSVSISKNTYKNYVIDSANIVANNTGRADLSGNKVAGVPTAFWNVRARYEPSFVKGVFIEANYQTVGEYFTDDRNTILVPSYSVLNATIGFREVGLGALPVALSGFFGMNNLSNAKYVASAFVNPDVARINGVNVPVFIEPGLPRNFTGSLSLRVKL